MQHGHLPPSGSDPPDGRAWHEQPGWRNDFPIDWEHDHYVSRRDFVKFLCLTSLGFAVGQLCLLGNAWLNPPVQPERRPVARLDELPVGQSLPFTYPTDRHPCLLVRLSESELVAYSQLCTHLSCPVVAEVARERFFCPCHNGAFDLRDGRPIMGPPRRPLPRIQLAVEDGTVYAVGVLERTS